MRLLVLALCAGLAAALPTAYDAGDNVVDTGSKVFKSSSQEASSHVSEEASYFYSQDGGTIIEITVEEAPAYNLVCMPSKQLVESAEVIVQETVDEEAEAAAAAAAAAAAEAAAASAAGAGAASSSAAGVGAASSAAAGAGAASSAAAGAGAASSAAAGAGAASSAAAGAGAASSAAAGEGAASSAAAGAGAASSAAAGEGAASSAAAGEGAASSAAAGEGAASSAAAGEGAASSAAAGEGAASSAAAGEGAASSAAAGGGAASSAAAGEGAASSAAAGEGAASSAAAGAGAAASAGAGASASAGAGDAEDPSAAIYVEEGYDDFTHCTCVPYYLCKVENIVSDGSGQINIRFGADDAAPTNTKCRSSDSVCCLHPEPRPLQEIVDDYLSEPYHPSCGRRNPEGFGFSIEGYKDSEAQFGEFPAMAIILEEEYVGGVSEPDYVCGGSLITPGVILTAAHCVAGKDASKLLVRLGDWNTKSETELLPFQQIRVSRTVIHERFNPKSLFNTIALVFLESEAELQPHIDTICLPSEDDVTSGASFYDDTKCVATGFGREQFEGGENQNIMKQVDLKEVPHKECQDKLRQTKLGRWFRLHKSFTCAGGEPGVDTCRGDGGSPLICPLRSHPDKYVQVGIVAWGIGCGQRGVPGVYASVIELLPWILQKLDAQPGHSVEELVESHEAVQVCITKNPLVQYEETIPIKVLVQYAETDPTTPGRPPPFEGTWPTQQEVDTGY